ncbi:MAG: hypothetical protein ACFFE8_00220 [Candidatus Heimdallarchaeota archaeon]
MFEFIVEYLRMAISKDQELSPGQFYPPYAENTIYYCRAHDTKGLIKDMVLFSIVIGIFSFLLFGWLAIGVLIVAWIFLLIVFLPRHYKLIQLDKHAALYGVGSFSSSIFKRNLYQLTKLRYRDLKSIKFDQWERRLRGRGYDRIGRIQIESRLQSAPFHILVPHKDLGQLIKIFQKYRFAVKFERKISPRELVILFSS